MPTDRLRAAGRPLDLDELSARLAGADLVLLGEATHGTHEFYAVRAELTRRLVAGHGFSAVAVEADWPDAARVTRYVTGEGDDPDPAAALGDFTRFPTWMWRNTVVAGFVGWLREHNARRRADVAVGFHGLDLYSLYTSIEAVVRYLDGVDAQAAERARLRYACFDHVGVDGQRYGYATASGAQEPCEDEVVAQLVELRRRAGEDGDRERAAAHGWAFFDAQQNARLVANAERYYRTMFRSRDDAWNLRDTHMADTLDALVDHLGERVDRPKVVVWAHNSHLGDACATEMGERRGELNLGQLARERHGDRVVNVGFTTYAGEVTAASHWDGPTQRQRVRDALPGSYEASLHDAGLDRAWLDLHDAEVASALAGPRLERAIGVVYRPDTERVSHYFSARLPDQFDVVIHLDETRALEPLDRTSAWDRGAVGATYPWAV